jgi:hypothetical protein
LTEFSRRGKVVLPMSTKSIIATILNENHVNYLIDLKFVSWEEAYRWMFSLISIEQFEYNEFSFVEE